MSGKSSLTKALEKWTKQGGDLNDILAADFDRPVKSRTEAEAICAAIDALRAEPNKAGEDSIFSPLHTLAAFFQQVESKEAFEVLSKEGLPRLRKWVRDLLDGLDIKADDVMFILKILAMYRQREDVALIAEVAGKPVNDSGFMWSIIPGQFDADHPFSVEMARRLSDPLPTGFILVSCLDMANGLAIAGKLERHPFDSAAGRNHLKAWLSDTNEDFFSYARSATTALPFIAHSSRKELLRTALNHLDALVRLEAARAQAKSGDPAGLERLSELCLNPHHSFTAQRLLTELGCSDKIPRQARQPDFQAVAEMADWLAHPNEFGRSPDEIELYDTRELFWSPTNDKRQLWLIRYNYNNEAGDEPYSGIGMVGSVTFALFGEATADLSAEDIYSLHCCWELELNQDSRAPKKRSIKAGRKILSRQNAGF